MPVPRRVLPQEIREAQARVARVHSLENPNPEISRLSEVWIRIPLNFDPTAGTSDARVFIYCLFVCYGVDDRRQGVKAMGASTSMILPSASTRLPHQPSGETTRRSAPSYPAFIGNELT